MPRSAHETAFTLKNAPLTLDDLMSVLETVLEGQQEIKEQQLEIIEKLGNLGLERDDYPGYRE